MTDRDSVLVVAARSGDREAFARLVERHRPMLVALCHGMLADGALAEDAAQEAVVLALTGLGRLRHPDRFGAWLAGIGLNVCRGWLRLRRRDPWTWAAALGGSAADAPDEAPTPEEAAEDRELAALVRDAVARLPDGQRAAVVLFYLGGLSHSESAAALGTTVGSVKTRLHKARTNLRRALARPDEEPPMNTPDTTPVTMHVAGVHRLRHAGEEPASERHVVLLADGHGRSLPIWIGPFEATALALALESVELPRPSPWQLSARLLEASGSSVRRVVVSRISDGTFYAVVRLDVDGDAREVDARPSDALNLALETGAEIAVDPGVLEAVARQEEEQPDRATDAVVRRSEAQAADIARETLARWGR